MSINSENSLPAVKRKRRTDHLQPWKPGQSGNPGGRPKALIEVRDLARTHTTAAIQTLAEMLKAKNERVRVAAAEALLDRGWGKAPAVLNIEERSLQVQISTAELVSRFRDLLPADVAGCLPNAQDIPRLDIPRLPDTLQHSIRPQVIDVEAVQVTQAGRNDDSVLRAGGDEKA